MIQRMQTGLGAMRAPNVQLTSLFAAKVNDDTGQDDRSGLMTRSTKAINAKTAAITCGG